MIRVAILFSLLILPVAQLFAGDTRIDHSGFIFGTVTTSNGKTYTGFLRWGNEETFWGDLFNSDKGELPHIHHLPKELRERDKNVDIFGVTVATWEENLASRAFVARFGDIDYIEMDGRDSATLHMKSGTVYNLRGGSNDTRAKIQIVQEDLSVEELRWSRISSIHFKPAPKYLLRKMYRLYGVFTTSQGVYEGFFQWDHDETTSFDALDGDTDSGDLSIAFGEIAKITKVRGGNASEVVLWDGRSYVLDGSNDVDDGNRGIYLDTPQGYRIEIPWRVFESVEIKKELTSGPGYESFQHGMPLKGTVYTANDQRSGYIVYDLDESEGWELLHGDQKGLAYMIPFYLVATLEPKGASGAELTLRDGSTLQLADRADVSEDNLGILVFAEGGDSAYYKWEDVTKIEFDFSQDSQRAGE